MYGALRLIRSHTVSAEAVSSPAAAASGAVKTPMM
jgi:hypothetical protein